MSGKDVQCHPESRPQHTRGRQYVPSTRSKCSPQPCAASAVQLLKDELAQTVHAAIRKQTVSRVCNVGERAAEAPVKMHTPLPHHNRSAACPSCESIHTGGSLLDGLWSCCNRPHDMLTGWM